MSRVLSSYVPQLCHHKLTHTHIMNITYYRMVIKSQCTNAKSTLRRSLARSYSPAYMPFTQRSSPRIIIIDELHVTSILTLQSAYVRAVASIWSIWKVCCRWICCRISWEWKTCVAVVAGCLCGDAQTRWTIVRQIILCLGLRSSPLYLYKTNSCLVLHQCSEFHI